MPAITFAAPWILLALASLPVLWWLFKVTPPAARRLRFPAIAFLIGLDPDEHTPARTPPWLVALRLLLAGLIILALAEPLMNPFTPMGGSGPILLVADDGWAAAPDWAARQAAMQEIVNRAAREDRGIVLLTTAPEARIREAPEARIREAPEARIREAPEARVGEAPAARIRKAPAARNRGKRASGVLRPAEARSRIRALMPKPWPVDRAAALARLGELTLARPTRTVWISDGIDDGQAYAFAEILQRMGSLEVVAGRNSQLPRLLLPPVDSGQGLTVGALRATADSAAILRIRASAEGGRLIAREEMVFADGATRAERTLHLPAELRNRLVRLEIEGEQSAGAVVLVDERWRRRPVGLVSGESLETSQPLLSDLFYLRRGLDPFVEIRSDTIAKLFERELALLILADVGKLTAATRDTVDAWIRTGGTVMRFAGPRLAQAVDDLIPVRLRIGDRSIGGAMSWTKPAALAPFTKDSPFAGIPIPADIRIRRQVLAEPALDLHDKTWARLADGTPLITAERRGRGWLILVHTTANAEWSNLPFSGLFVAMLRRVVALSQGVSGRESGISLAPIELLDGFGRATPPPANARAIPPGGLDQASVGADHPPGFYGNAGNRHALNLSAGLAGIAPIKRLPAGIRVNPLALSGQIDLAPWLLTAALILLLADGLVGLALRGLLTARLRGAAAGIALFVFAIPLAASADDMVDRKASADNMVDRMAMEASLETRLAYVRTGIAPVDAVSRAGLIGLSATLTRRTAIEPRPPLEVDLARHELAFLALLYWPVIPDQEPLSATVAAKIGAYLKNGGMILFDTRDQEDGVSGIARAKPASRVLRRILARLNLPPLVPVPKDHVLTKSFYLLSSFPGRWAGGRVWVERHGRRVNDGVSSVVVGGNDWARAWAVDGSGRPLFAVVPGGDKQREHAFRFGVNLVMYALTGNYKADQVHIPAILERLGH